MRTHFWTNDIRPCAAGDFYDYFKREVVTCPVKMDIKTWSPWTREARKKQGLWGRRAALPAARHAAANAACVRPPISIFPFRWRTSACTTGWPAGTLIPRTLTTRWS
nr:MAG TPA: hypothetical protein [Caudoviricetes sp.]